MKHLPYLFTAICLVTSLFSCQPKQTTEIAVESPENSYAESYKAPDFETDDRLAKIKQIVPELQKSIEEHAKAENLPGVAFGIVVDNELVFTSATGYLNLEKEIPATPTSAFRIASMSKSFTAMAIVKLRDEGKLKLNDPVSKYIPKMAKLTYLTKDAPTIDIENLLTMTAGFPEDNPWGDRQLDEPDQMLIGLVEEGISFSNVPSYRYEYSNTGYALLGHIVSVVSGMPYQDYITQNIFKPLGMNNTYWEYEGIPEDQLAIGYRWEDEQWKLEPMLHDGAFGAMGGIITSIEDFSKYVSFQLSAWPPRNDDDNGPIKRSSLREMQTPQYPRLYANARDYNGDDCAVLAGYGFGLAITEFCNGLKWVSHGGALPGFGSNYTFYPEYGVGIMAFCNLTYTSPWSLNELNKLLFETADLQPRKLPASDILLERQTQITQLIQQWDPALEAQILAENFYLDRSREKRMAAVQEVLEKAGAIDAVGNMQPINQLRGRYSLQAENGTVNIFFTLTPEQYPKVQRLDVAFEPNEP